jgi:carbonic anhydrase
MHQLKKGYDAFQDAICQDPLKYLHPPPKQQKPHSMVISCCDSRVNPCQIFQANAGEIFLFQNIAGHLPDPNHPSSTQTKAALQFGIENLNINNLIFLAHTDCAGLRAATQHYQDLHLNLKNWLQNLQALPADNEAALLQAHLNQNSQNALKHPFIANKVNNNSLTLQQMVYQVENGTLLIHRNGQLIAF